MSQASREYVRRIDQVIDHLRANLDRPVQLAELAQIACFSEFHFHRIFGAIVGETVKGFTSRLRLEKAARLLRCSRQSATDIALECGFSSSATFSRAFSRAFGASPREFRKTGNLKNSKICKELFPEHEYILPMTLMEKEAAFPIEFKNFPSWNVAYIRVSDAFEGDKVLRAFERVLKWASAHEIADSGTLFGMSIDDPSITPKKLYRYEVCFASDIPFDCPEELSKMSIPSRTYATTQIRGDIKWVATAWDYLFGHWLIKSNYEPDHAPALEIFLNKKEALDWSCFELELCLPIQQINTN